MLLTCSGTPKRQIHRHVAKGKEMLHTAHTALCPRILTHFGHGMGVEGTRTQAGVRAGLGGASCHVPPSALCPVL